MPLSNATSSAQATTRSTKVTPFNVGASKTSVVLATSNPNRKGLTIWNESAFILCIELGKSASPSAFSVKITPGSYYELPYGYTGIISGIWLVEEGEELKGLAMVRELI